MNIDIEEWKTNPSDSINGAILQAEKGNYTARVGGIADVIIDSKGRAVKNRFGKRYELTWKGWFRDLLSLTRIRSD